MDEITNTGELADEIGTESESLEEENAPEEEEPLVQDELDSEEFEPEEEAEGGFSYDEEGNIIIPEETSGEGVSETESEEEKTEEKGGEASDAKDAEIAQLRREREEYEALVKDALARLGVKSETGRDGLIKLAAEAADMTPEEYIAKREEEAKLEKAKRFIQQSEFEQKAQKDLAEIHAAFPETKIYKTIYDIPNLDEFGSYRDKGLSAKKAYIAANPDTVRSNVAEAARRKSLNESKNHLRSNVPKGSKDSARHMTRQELESYRDLFPDLSVKEITELYRGVNK